MGANSVEFHPGALRDAQLAYEWYFERSPKAAAGFEAELKRSVETIRRDPDRWPFFTEGCRRFVLRRFPFSVLYSVHESVVTVWAIAHASRSPEFWTKRL
jgi:plasmid stabilization system protein ParE